MDIDVSIQLIAPASGAIFTIILTLSLDPIVSIQLIAPASGALLATPATLHPSRTVSIQLIAPASGASSTIARIAKAPIEFPFN